jgi:transposase
VLKKSLQLTGTDGTGACYKEEFLPMSFWISIAGGLLIMMGHHARSEALFYYFRLEDQVPERHLLRLIEKHINFGFVRERLKDSYSETGRPSIDPELLLRILLIGYLYGITSERKLVEELRMHLAWRWFTGLGFDQEIPHHSTFSKNRHGRFQESKLFEQLFEEIVRQCVAVGLVQGDNLSVDGSFVEANASKESRIPREQLTEAAQVNQTVRQYLVELEQQNPTEEPVHQQEQVSTTDPDATYATKGGTPARLGYYDNYLIDNHSCVIVGVQATAARMSQETVAAQDMIARYAQWQGRNPESVVADATYGNGEFLQWLIERGITPYMRTRDSALRTNNPLYGPDRFTYLPESNSYLCPAGQQLNFVGLNVRNRTHAYIGSRKRCGACPQKEQCTTGQYKYLAIHIHEAARQRARELARTPAFANFQRQRKKVEALFAELKNQIGLRRLRLRRLKFVREQFFLAATAQNIKRLVRFLSQYPKPPLQATI